MYVHSHNITVFFLINSQNSALIFGRLPGIEFQLGHHGVQHNDTENDEVAHVLRQAIAY